MVNSCPGGDIQDGCATLSDGGRIMSTMLLRNAMLLATMDDDGRQIEDGGLFVRDGVIWLRTNAGDLEVMPVNEVQLRGAHNLLNVLAACAAASAAGIPLEAMREGVQGFGGVSHRLEFVRQWGGADWYNDSKATTPDASVTAIRAFEEPLVVLAGGRDKHLPWDEFARTARERVSHLVTAILPPLYPIIARGKEPPNNCSRCSNSKADAIIESSGPGNSPSLSGFNPAFFLFVSYVWGIICIMPMAPAFETVLGSKRLSFRAIAYINKIEYL